jgi:hypothetical protein
MRAVKAKSSPQSDVVDNRASVISAANILDQATAEVLALRYTQAEMLLIPLPGVFVAGGDRVRAAESVFWLGYCCEQLGRTDQAEVRYLDVLRDFPRTPAARMARVRLQLLPPRAKDF